MKYADWKAERDRLDIEIRDAYAISEPKFAAINEAQVALDLKTRREYDLSDRVTLIVHANYFYLRVEDDSRLQQHDVDLNNLTVEDLEAAIKAIKMRERWRSGELAELPPSGNLPK